MIMQERGPSGLDARAGIALGLLAAVVLPGLTSAQEREAAPRPVLREQDPDNHWVRRFEETFDLERGTRTARIESKVGQIHVALTDADEASLRVIVKADKEKIEEREVSDERSAHLEFDQADGNLTLRDRHMQDNAEGWSLEIELRLPRSLSLQIDTSVGNVLVEEVSNRLEVHIGVGNVVLRTQSIESIEIEGRVGSVEVGKVALQGAARISIGVGSAALDLTRITDDIEVTTETGAIALALPADISASFDLEAALGDVRCDPAFGIETERRGTGAVARGQTGRQGGPKVTLHTRIGSVAVGSGASRRLR